MDASFTGTLIKEALSVRKPSIEYSKIELTDSHTLTGSDENLTNAEVDDAQGVVIKRKTNVCYCVLKLARHGELFKVLEHTDKFSDSLARSLFT
jgi:hypothetical protein